MAERPGIISEISDPQIGGTGHGHTGHTDMWAIITELRAAVQELRQREAAYDTLVAAGEEKQRRALGLEPARPAPRHRRGGGLAVVPTAVFLALSQIWTGALGRHA